MDNKILRVKRDDVYAGRGITKNSRGPNRVPWNVYYIVPCVEPLKLWRMFQNAFVIFPSTELCTVLAYELLGRSYYSSENVIRQLRLRNYCIVVPTHVLSNSYYAYQFSRYTARGKHVTMGNTGVGNMKYLDEGEFTTPCLHCRRAAYNLTNDCSPGTDVCIRTFWRTNEQQS